MSYVNLPVLCHGRTISDELVFPLEEYKSREDKVRAIINENGLDGLLIYSDGLSRGHVCYLTNFHCFVTWSVALIVFPKEGNPTLLATIAPRDLVFTKKALPEFVEVIPVGLSLISNHHIIVKAIECLKNKDLFDGKWGGVNLKSLPSMAYKPLREAFPEIPDCTAEYNAIREVKSSRELHAISQAASMAKKAVFEYLRLAVEGTNEIQLSALIDRQFRVNGADAVSILVSSGSEDTQLRLPEERNYKAGEMLSVFANIQYQRYNGAYGATATVGGASIVQKDLLELAVKYWEEKVQEMFQTKRVYIGQKQTCCGKQLTCSYTVINGIGLDLLEAPDEYNTEHELRPGMTLNMSLNVKKQGVGSAFMSQTLLVGDDFMHPLNGFGI